MKFLRLWTSLREISIRKVIVNNLWLKLLSLGMAIIIWLYVNGELTQGIKI